MGPVHHERTLPAATTVALVVVLTGAIFSVAAAAGPTAMFWAVLLAGIILAWGWAGALALPSPRGTAATLVLATVVLSLVVRLTDEDPLTWLPAALGGSVVLAFGHQLLRRDGRPRLTESVAFVLLGLCVLASGVMFVALSGPRGSHLIVAAMLAGSVAAGVELLGRWERVRPWTVPLALIAGGAAALAYGQVAERSDWSVYLVIGVAVAGLGHAVRSVFSVLPTMAHARPALVSAITSVLATGAVVTMIAWVLADILG